MNKSHFMEKILVLMDPMKPGNNALEFTCFLRRQTPSRITCILLDDSETPSPVQRDLHGFPVVFADQDVRKNQIATEAGTEARIYALKKKYAGRDVDFKSHRNFTLA